MTFGTERGPNCHLRFSASFDEPEETLYTESGLRFLPVMGTVKTISVDERIARVGQRRQIVIPRDILETLKIGAGDFVAFSALKDGVLIKPKRIAGHDVTLSPADAKIVRRGEAQLKRGESKAWRVVKHALSR